jgi:hypothetical protein
MPPTTGRYVRLWLESSVACGLRLPAAACRLLPAVSQLAAAMHDHVLTG